MIYKNTPEFYLLMLAKEFYYNSYEKAKIKPTLFSKTLCEIDSQFIYLRNSAGTEVQIKYTRSHFFIEINGIQYFAEIKNRPKVARTICHLNIESDLLSRIKDLCKARKLPINLFIEELMTNYLEENNTDPEDPETI